MKVIISPHILVPPKKPITQDMREMVERLEQMGEIKEVPGAYQFRQSLIMHPAIYDKMVKVFSHNGKPPRRRTP